MRETTMRAIGKTLRRGSLAALALAASQPAGAETTPPLSVGRLLADGWEVAGFAPSLYVLGSVILFKHKDRNYFVQCSAVYDATRSAKTAERVVTNCYEIH
jgi:hypothetical protein